VLHAAGPDQLVHGRGPRRVQVGPGGDDDELVRLLPGLYKDPNVGGDKIGFFVNPSDKGKGSQLGGQGISVVAYSPNRAEALSYIKWFATPDVQKKWWALGGYSAHNAVLKDPGFTKSAPFAGEFLTAMDQVVDFWADPSYAQLLLAEQKRIHDFVVPTRARRRRRWTVSSRIGRRCSRKTGS
jgi:ABC-type glycerol-3-phosphate transport system substrate-binding protein